MRRGGHSAGGAAVHGTYPHRTSAARTRKNVQYNTGFLLPPGSYHLKFVVRENQNGLLGTL